MAADAKSVKAIIRASRPKFKCATEIERLHYTCLTFQMFVLQTTCRCACRSREAKLAFAVHAFLLAEGYKLIAVGKRADEEAPGELQGLCNRVACGQPSGETWFRKPCGC